MSSGLRMVAIQFELGIIQAANAVILRLNKIKGIEIDIMGTTDQFDRLNEAIKDSGKDFNTFFAERLKDFVETDVAGDLGAYWEKLAEEQRQILKDSKAVADEINNLPPVGDAGGTGGDQGAGGGNTSGGGTTGGIGRAEGQTMEARWGTIGTVRGSNSRYGSRFGATPTMAERERMAGLNLAGNDTMAGRRPGAGQKPNGKEAEVLTEAQKQTKSLSVIEKEITRNP